MAGPQHAAPQAARSTASQHSEPAHVAGTQHGGDVLLWFTCLARHGEGLPATCGNGMLLCKLGAVRRRGVAPPGAGPVVAGSREEQTTCPY